MSAPTLKGLLDAKEIGARDAALAEMICEIAGEEDELVLVSAALACARATRGSTCVDLRRSARRPVGDGGDRWYEYDEWMARLRGSRAVARDGDDFAPLVLDNAGRLYLRRYYDRERSLAGAVRELADAGRLEVVTGGPGTGKTFTVASRLARLIEEALSSGAKPPRIQLLAPTGKAAARMVEAIARAKLAAASGARACSERAMALVPMEAATIHRALVEAVGIGEKAGRGRRRLLYDVVVVDEASMVDLELMTRLVAALAPGARLFLLGDADQLASVEAGSVLGDICGGAGEDLAEGGPIAGCIRRLTRTYRFDQAGGIGRLASAVKTGRLAEVRAVFDDADAPEVRLVEGKAADMGGALRADIPGMFGAYGETAEPAARLALLDKARVLCAHREGPLGLDEINGAIRARLFGGQHRGAPEWYDGRPVMVARNDHRLGLYNGDVGVTRVGPDGIARVRFEGAGVASREIGLARLPPCETAFALTVHKAQGSEFDHVALVLPPGPSPVVTRALLYTAVTRARRSLTLYSESGALAAAVETDGGRDSGLRDMLWGVTG